jgi:hypothetical protein
VWLGSCGLGLGHGSGLGVERGETKQLDVRVGQVHLLVGLVGVVVSALYTPTPSYVHIHPHQSGAALSGARRCLGIGWRAVCHRLGSARPPPGGRYEKRSIVGERDPRT